MLSRQQRLSATQFKTVMEKGRVLHSPLFLVRSIKTSKGPSRFAAVAPSKSFGTAVSRAKARRRVYEAVQTLYPSIELGNQTIIFAKKSSEDVKFNDLQVDLKNLFVKAALLK